MGKRIKFAIAILLIAVTFVTGTVLGTWQIQRLHWKSEIIAQLDATYKNPTPLDLDTIAQTQPDYIYGEIKGIFDYSKEIFIGPVTHNNVISKKVITPLSVGGNTVFVMRGYIPIEKISSYKSPENNKATITGLLKRPTWNNFTSNNQPSEGIWVKPDIKEIAKHLETENTYPYLLQANSIDPHNDKLVKVSEDKWYPRNKHTQYATFWFSMSVILIIFFGFIFWRTRKS